MLVRERPRTVGSVVAAIMAQVACNGRSWIDADICNWKGPKGQFSPLFSIDGAFFSTLHSYQRSQRNMALWFIKESHKTEFFTEQMTSGNSEVALLIAVRRRMIAVFLFQTHFTDV